MKHIILALVLLGSGLLAGCEQEKKEIDNVKLAEFYLEQGNDQLAMQVLAGELRENANQVDAHRLLGVIFNGAEYYAEAVRHYRQSMELGCDTACTAGLVDAYIGLGDAEQAENEFRRMDGAGDAPAARYRAAMIDFLKTGDQAATLERLQAIDYPAARDREFLLMVDIGLHQELYSRFDPAAEYTEDQLLAMATAAFLLKRYQVAEDILLKLNVQRSSRLLTRKKVRAVDLLVKTNLAQDKISEAELIYHNFLKNNEGSGFVAMQNAVNQLVNNNYDAALNQIGALAEANPDSLQLAQVLALAQFGKRDFIAVIKILEGFGGNLETRSKMLLAEAYNNVGRPQDAIKLLEDISDNNNALLIRARSHLQRGEKPKTLALIEPLGATGDNPTFDQKLAQLWFDLGDYQQVIQRFGQDAEADIKVMYLVANSYLKLEQTSKAQAYAERATDTQKALELRAYIAAGSGDMAAAVTLFEELVRKNPGKKYLLMLATGQFELGQYGPALESLRRGLDMEGENQLLLVLANRLLSAANSDDSYAWLDSVPREHTDYDSVQRMLANFDISREQIKRALGRLKPLVDKNDSQAMLLMARAKQSSDPAEALRLLERSLQVRFTLGAASLLHRNYLGRQDRNNLARINNLIEQEVGANLSSAPLLASGYLALGQFDKAQQLAGNLEQQGYTDQAQQLRADSLARQGKHLEAARLYAKLLKTRSSENLLVKYYAASASAGIDLKILLKEAEKRLDAAPDMHRLRNFVGLRYIDIDNRAAVKHLTRLAEIYPDDVVLLNNLAWANLNVDPAAALRYSEKAYSSRGENFDILDTHVRALASNRRVGEARKIVQARLEQNPDDTRLKALLESLN